jgi:hypothetical protein
MAAFSFLSCAASRQSLHSDPIRRIGVCILNDARAPVEHPFIAQTLQKVFGEYEFYSGIQFTIIDYLPYHGDIDAWHFEQGTHLRRICPEQSQIRILFSSKLTRNREININGFTGDVESIGQEDLETGGFAHWYYGYVILYDCNENFRLMNAAGESLLLGAERHELAHLFSVEHVLHNSRSFMYPQLTGSHGEWTPEIIQALRANKHHARWFPNR